MTDMAAMLNAYPGTLPKIDDDALVICVQDCLNCAQACTSCADACAVDVIGSSGAPERFAGRINGSEARSQWLATHDVP